MIAVNLVLASLLAIFTFYWYREAYREWRKVPRKRKLVGCALGLGTITGLFAVLGYFMAVMDILGLP